MYQNTPRLLWVIFGLLLIVHVWIFRDVVAAIPAVMNGDASIVREELIPFFNFGSQFWGDNAAALTSSEEVRVSYSFWTAWVRYDKVLPFALVILNTLSAFILFYAFHRIGRQFYKKSLFGIAAALLAAFLIHVILLYAKVAHFYVLIIGFSMFALASSLFIEQVFFKQKIARKNIAAVSLLVLFNPAIHYHVIFYVMGFLILLFHLFFTAVMNRSFFWRYFRRGLGYFGVVTLLSLVPYVLYVLVTTSSSLSGVSTQIPVNYWMIYYASLSLPFIFSLDTAGHLDLIRHGNYLVSIPRFGSMIVTFLIGALLIFKRWKTLLILNKVFIMTLFGIMLFAMWMTIGYSEDSPYSFHRVFGDLAIFFSDVGGQVGSALAGLMKTFINILRFPHRFQFMYFYAAGILFMIALVWLRDVFMRKFRPAIASALVVLIALFPVAANGDYRTALLSGNLATFVAPYHIPDDLKQIKSILASKQDSKMFILPTLESGREIIQDGQRYSFLDKYLIYYLNEPTLYYGVGANTENKLSSYMVYRAISYDEAWWQDIMANNLGVTDILVPHHTRPREQGIAYLPEIDAKIAKSLASTTVYKKTYSGKDFSLYSLRKTPKKDEAYLVNMNWQNTLRYLNSNEKKEDVVYFPLQMSSYEKSHAKKRLLTDSVERSFYDFYSKRKSDMVFTPNPISLPFNSEYVASSNFTNNALSLSTLYAKEDNYNYLHENVPSLMNLQRPSFVGLTKGDVSLDVELKVPRDGKYRILVHGGSKGAVLQATVDGRTVSLQKIAKDLEETGDYVGITYFYVDVELKKGTRIFSLKNTEQDAVLVDSVGLLPENERPGSFDSIDNSWLRIQKTDQEGVFLVEFKR